MIDLYKQRHINGDLAPKKETSDDENSGGRVSTNATPNNEDFKAHTFAIEDDGVFDEHLLSPMDAN